MAPPTVLILQGSSHIAGAERALLTLASSVTPDNARLVIAAYGDGPLLSELARTADVRVERLGSLPRLRNAAQVPALLRELRSLVQRADPDVVQGTGEKMALLASWAAAGTRSVPVAWLHDAPAPRRSPAPFLLQAGAVLARRQSIVVVSEWMRSAFAARFRVDPVVIYNGVEMTRLPDRAASRRRVRTELGSSEHDLVVSFIGRLQKWKAPDLFLRAAARAVARHDGRPLLFLVVGGALYGRDERWAAALPQLAENLGLTGRVRFLGHRDDAVAVAAASDVVVHCSVQPEPFGMVVLESAAVGTPVVASKTGGPQEIVEDGESGLLTAPGDVDELAAAIVRLAGDADLRSRLSEGAVARAASFSGARMARAFEDLWRDTRQPTHVGAR